MQAPELKKRLVIEFDVVNGYVELDNEDEMSYIEILGALEYAKMMLYRDWMESLE